jgi:hypothetical protein
MLALNTARVCKWQSGIITGSCELWSKCTLLRSYILAHLFSNIIDQLRCMSCIVLTQLILFFKITNFPLALDSDLQILGQKVSVHMCVEVVLMSYHATGESIGIFPLFMQMWNAPPIRNESKTTCFFFLLRTCSYKFYHKTPY